MKRKRKITMPNSENDRPDLLPETNSIYRNDISETQSNSRNHRLLQNDVQSPVSINSVFNRLFLGLDNTNIETKNAANIRQSTTTPKTPSRKRRCVLGNTMNYLPSISV